jgi:hypothetical protein
MRFTAMHAFALLLHCAVVLPADDAAVRLEPARLQLGRFPANRPPSAELVLANGGGAPLEGVRVRTGCGCVSAVAAGDSVPPGGRLSIRLSISSERISGPFSHSVFVEAGSSLLRASETGEAVPLFTVRPQNAVNLGDVACGSPFQAVFRLNATESASLGRISPASLAVEVVESPPSSFRVTLRGTVPGKPGRFRLSAFIPVASPAGWNPVELAVFGNSVEIPVVEKER